ncbi:unnamed protein product [Discosporangium mesarthrocarpum]
MADSWEDEDFETPAFIPPSDAPISWEDEDEVDEAVPEVAPGVAPKMSAAKAAKKAAEGDAKLAAEVEAKLQVNETSEERRLRERNRVEEADNSLTEELFGGEGRAGGVARPAGVAGLKISSLQDHMKLALELGNRFSSSKPGSVVAFLKELMSTLDGSPLGATELTEVTAHCIRLRDVKVAAAERIAAAKASASNTQANQRANKKKKVKQNKAHTDVFGGDFEGDAIDNAGMDYEDRYDDFM